MAEPAETPAVSFDPVQTPVAPQYFAETERYRVIAKLCAYYDGTQYRDRPDFWTGRKVGGSSGKPVPLRERAPCVVYPLPKAAVQQAVRYTFGEGKYPTVKCEPAEANAAVAGLALSKDDAADVTSYISELTEQCGLRPTMRTLLRHGLSAKTAVAMLAVREGKFAIDLAFAKDCYPKFKKDDPSSDVESLVWCYRFTKMVPAKDGKPEYKDHYFRRDLTADAVIVYDDTLVEENGKTPHFVVNTELSKAHGLGFCPVVWIRNMAEQCSGDIDGISIYADLEDEFDALNFALSQRHRGIVIFGVPQPWETGVEEGDGPGQTGRQAYPTVQDAAGNTYSGPTAPPYGGVEAVPARPTGPDQMWSYGGRDVKLGLLETTGKAFQAATEHVVDIRSRLLEAMSVVLVDTTKLAGHGAMSAKFLAMVFQDLFSLVDDLRPAWWQHGLARILSMMLRMTAVLGGDRILLPGAKQVADIMSRRSVNFEGETVWVPPKLVPIWGDYMSPSNDEIKVGVDAAAKAREAKILPQAAGTAFVASYFGIDDVDEAVKDLEKEADQETEKTLSIEHALSSMNGNANAPGNAGGGAKDKAASGVGGSAGAAAADAKA
jgi:hypothetical protein